MVGGLSAVTGPLTAAYWMQMLGPSSFFLLLAGVLMVMAVISIWRVLTVPALPPEYKAQSTLQAAPLPVGTVLHAEEEDPA